MKVAVVGAGNGGTAVATDLAYRGHEVACHTVTHPTIARCPLPEVAQEVLQDRKA